MRAHRVVGWIGGALVVTMVMAAIGGLVSHHMTAAVCGAALVLVIGLTAYDPVAVPVLMMPALAIVERVPGIDLSISDFALFGAFWFAVVFAPRPYSRPMRAMLWLSFGYQVASLFTVVAHPYPANAIEWFHAWLSVAGALVVGWSIGRSGRGRVALSLFVLPALGIGFLTLLAAPAVLSGVSDGVYLEQPFAMHKNYIGCLLAVAALVLYARPWWVGWPRWFDIPMFWFLATGVVISGARQALVGLAAGIFVIAVRTDPDRKRSKLVLLAAIPGVAGVVLAAQEQLSSDNPFNSANQRLVWYAESLEFWSERPWFGAGLRFWTTGTHAIAYQPPNAEIEVLASAGIVGLLGFLALFLGGFVMLSRMRSRFGTLALALLVQRFATAQFDLFWSSVQVAVPFTVIGICIGAEAYAESRARARHTTGSTLPSDGLRSVEEMVHT